MGPIRPTHRGGIHIQRRLIRDPGWSFGCPALRCNGPGEYRATYWRNQKPFRPGIAFEKHHKIPIWLHAGEEFRPVPAQMSAAEDHEGFSILVEHLAANHVCRRSLAKTRANTAQ